MRQYKLKKQIVDNRDFILKSTVHPAVKLPKVIDLRNRCPPVYDQGQLGSCTANAGVAARTMLDNLNVMLSRLFLYYDERAIEGTVANDDGASMRDIGKAILNYGICPETDYCYIPSQFNQKPSQMAYNEALAYKIKGYYSISTMDEIKQVLALKQQPVMIGIDVYESFESAKVTKTGKVPVPKFGEKRLGGHAILIVGYVEPILFGLIGGYFICRNSWGNKWGDRGYFYLPYAYFTKGYAYDFWVLN